MFETLLLATMLAPTRQDVLLDIGWEVVQTDVIADAPPATGWTPTSVPHTHMTVAPGPRTALWYRRTLEAPKAGRTFLEFEAAGKAATVFVDGKQVDRWLNSWSPRWVELTPWLAGRQTVELTVRCADRAELYREGMATASGAPVPGSVLWPLGGYHDQIGLVLPVRLHTRPDAHLADPSIRITPSVRQGTLEVAGTASGAPAGSMVELRLEGIAGVLDTVPVGQGGAWSAKLPATNLRLWSPEDPHLYHLVSTLRSAEGTVLDVNRTRFGFREMWTEGQYFVLNGVRRNLLASSTWPLAEVLPVEVVRERLLAVKESNAIAFRLHIGPWQKEFRSVADEVGLLIVEEAPLYTDGTGMYAYDDPEFWQNSQQVIDGLIGWSYNHPSVVLWSLGNEILFMGNAGRATDLPRKLGDLARAARRVDASRPMMFEADLDPDGAYDVIGLHYPHELPNVHAYPIVADWLGSLKQTEAGGGMLGTRSSAFQWDRAKPLYIGEYLWVPMGDHSAGTVYFGPEAYANRGEFTSKARHRSWFDQTVAYRRSGVSGLCPWTAFGFGVALENAEGRATQRDFYTPIAAFPRHRELRSYANSTRTLTYDVFNESVQRQVLSLELHVGDQMLERRLNLDPADTEPIQFQVTLPSVPTSTVLACRSVLRADGRAVDERTFEWRIEPRPSAGTALHWVRADEDWSALEAGVTAVLASGALDPSPVPEAAGRVVVGSPGPDVQGIKSFVARGGTLVVLEHSSLAALGLPVQLVDHVSTMAFADDPNWPSLKFWGQDMVVARKQLLRSGRSGLRSLATSGGPQSLAQAPAGLLRYGQGRFVFLQAEVGGKLDEDPAAWATLRAAVRAAHADGQTREGRVVVVGGSPELWAVLGKIELDAVSVDEADPVEPVSGVILAGGTMPDWLPAKQAPVLWFVSDSDDWARHAGELSNPGLTFQPGRHTTSWHAADPLLVGVTAEELTLTTPPVNWDRVIQVPTGTCVGALMPEPGPTWTTLPGGAFIGEQRQVEGSALLLRRRNEVAAVLDGQGWTPIEVDADALQGAVVRLSVEGRTVEFLSPQGVARTWVYLPKAGSKLGLAVDNAASWGDDGPALRLRAVRVGSSVMLPAPVRALSGAGVAMAWSDVLATTLSPAALSIHPVRSERLLSAWCANLGMRFRMPQTSMSDALPLDQFVTEGGQYNVARGDVLELRSTGSGSIDLWVARPGDYEVAVDAEASPAAGVYPEFSIEQDGIELVRAACTTASRHTYRLKVRLREGARRLTLRFLNDANVAGEDRNLFVRRIALGFAESRAE